MPTKDSPSKISAWNILSKALRYHATRQGYELEVRDDYFAIIKGTRFAVSWLPTVDDQFHGEVLTNYTRDRKWTPLKNSVSGNVTHCLKRAIELHEFWKPQY